MVRYPHPTGQIPIVTLCLGAITGTGLNAGDNFSDASVDQVRVVNTATIDQATSSVSVGRISASGRVGMALVGVPERRERVSYRAWLIGTCVRRAGAEAALDARQTTLAARRSNRAPPAGPAQR